MKALASTKVCLLEITVIVHRIIQTEYMYMYVKPGIWQLHMILKLSNHIMLPTVHTMEERYIHELERGLPWPILSAAEYLSTDHGDLRWMRIIHEAGHFTYIMLWWVISCLFLNVNCIAITLYLSVV